MNVYAIGASRNIGYHAACRLLAKGATVTFLLRSPSIFDNDERIQPYISSGTARIVKGDALKPEDVKRGWEVALEAKGGAVHLLLFTLGGMPSVSLTKGFVISPHDLCSRSLLNTLTTMPASLRDPASQPRFVVISSIGITHAGHAKLPLPLRLFYGGFLQQPHVDKLAMERIVAHCGGWGWTEKELPSDVLPAGWAAEPDVPAEGSLKHAVVVRPALLTSGSCKADKPKAEKAPYRVEDHELGDGYSVSREDVAHFIVEGLLENWSQWEGKAAHIGY